MRDAWIAWVLVLLLFACSIYRDARLRGRERRLDEILHRPREAARRLELLDSGGRPLGITRTLRIEAPWTARGA